MGGEAAGLTHQLEGGMKLSLSREEEEARKRVQLPYEHQGKVGQPGDDTPFRYHMWTEQGSQRRQHLLSRAAQSTSFAQMLSSRGPACLAPSLPSLPTSSQHSFSRQYKSHSCSLIT